jgi:hypothetical protein
MRFVEQELIKKHVCIMQEIFKSFAFSEQNYTTCYSKSLCYRKPRPRKVRGGTKRGQIFVKLD